MAGWIYLPRFVDKIRLHLAGKLHPDYQQNFAKRGFDDQWLKAAGVTADQFIEVVRQSITDGEVCDWVQKHVSRAAEQSVFTQFILNHGRENEPELRKRLQMRKEQAGIAHREEIQTFIDFIDVDEKRK